MKSINKIIIGVYGHFVQIVVTVPTCRSHHNGMGTVYSPNSIDNIELDGIPGYIRNSMGFVEDLIIKVWTTLFEVLGQLWPHRQEDVIDSDIRINIWIE